MRALTHISRVFGCFPRFAQAQEVIGDVAMPELKVEICGQCHPFYTGRQKFVDTAGRIQRFQEKYGWKGDTVKKASEKKKVKRPVAATAEDDDF